MPQMSPLMWGLMFIIFSLLMLMTFVKIYFNYSGEMSPAKMTDASTTPKLNLTWMW